MIFSRTRTKIMCRTKITSYCRH